MEKHGIINVLMGNLVAAMILFPGALSAQQQSRSVRVEIGEELQAPVPASTQGDDGYFDDLAAARKTPALVRTLNLQNQQLTAVPSDLGLFKNLEELDLSHNAIQSIALDFHCGASLRRLFLNENKITAVPAEIAQFSGLEVLAIHGNPVASIDAAIGKLGQLRDLRIGGNGDIASWQPAIWGLSRLENLRAWHFGLTEVPDEVANLAQLKSACFAHNHIARVTAKIGTLTQLTYLNFGDNSLTYLPNELVQLTKLEYFGMYQNPITALPADFSAIAAHLKILSAWHTGLSESAKAELKGRFSQAQVLLEPTDIH